jgi:hypothetical protein
MHQAHTLFGKFVNLPAAIGIGVGALLLRPGDIGVRLPCEQRQAIDEVVEAAAAECLQVIRRQIAVASKRSENALDVTLGDDGEFRPPVLPDRRSIAPARVARAAVAGRHRIFPVRSARAAVVAALLICVAAAEPDAGAQLFRQLIEVLVGDGEREAVFARL